MKNVLFSWGRVFIVAVLIKFMDLGANVFALNIENLQHLVQAGVVSIIPVLIRFLNPNDASYGIQKKVS